ncbi:MAG: HK97-gp10 family putative phage morphogenesis protein [Clostridium sp.]|uniref:HK97-gp10 family putative phage morphogenesis protein n=1 Tax=Clostridium sp. TaxID=1506 RepID=UPI003F2D6150
MYADIEVDGLEELQEFMEGMIIDDTTEMKAVRKGIKVMAKSIEDNSPVGQTGKLKKMKTKVKKTPFGAEGIANSTVFYDKFQEFGTSQQKANVGYFDRAVEDASDEAVRVVADTIFSTWR